MDRTITVDRRETQKVYDLLKFHKFKVRIDHVKLGDICSQHCIVERKEFGDFVNSVIDRRVFSQTKRMMYDEKPTFLLMHGVWDIKRQIHGKQIAGALASLLVRTATPTLVMLNHPHDNDVKKAERRNFSNAMYIAGKICEKVEEGKFLKPRLWKKWEKPKVPIKVDKVSKLFGVPAVVAARMLKRFKSLRGICLAKHSELLQITGIGDVRASSILKLVT